MSNSTNGTRLCPIMSTKHDKQLCEKELCAWYMTINGAEEGQGLCAIAFGMLCQQGIAGEIEFTSPVAGEE